MSYELVHGTDHLHGPAGNVALFPNVVMNGIQIATQLTPLQLECSRNVYEAL